MRAYRRIGGHSWSQPIMELVHKQRWGILLITEETGDIMKVEMYVTEEESKTEEDPHVMYPNKLAV